MTKTEQFQIIQQANPAPDDIHTWIRAESDIRTFSEVLVDYDPAPDYSMKMMKFAELYGILKVYSSKPIVPGVFVTPSKMEAEGYSGGEIYEMLVPTDAVAWIDAMEGMYTGR